MDSVYFVDTNIFIRYLTHDDQQKFKACLTLFQRAERHEIELTTSSEVICEVVFVLSSKFYKLPRQAIQATLSKILGLSGFRLPERSLCFRALSLFATHPIDYEDCMTVARMEQQGLAMLYSYDRDFERFSQLIRCEPGQSV
ncbi:MAG: PIN domain-containing protein [Caldilineaceae bacterium]